MTWMPRVDIVKKDDHLLIRADLPGMTKDAVEVTLDNGDLVLSGERKEETEDTADPPGGRRPFDFLRTAFCVY